MAMPDPQDVDDDAVPETSGPPPDPLLKKLYNSDRPAVELSPGVGLSPILNAVWLPKDSKALAAETWLPEVVEEADPPVPPPPSFDPASIEYTDMAVRLSRSAPLLRFNELTIQIKEMENEIVLSLDKGRRETLEAELEPLRASLADVEFQLTELRASFQEDPLALVPWMKTLFDLADAGMTTFDVSGHFWPYTKITELFAHNNSTSHYDSAEKILGIFRRRYEKERGPGKIQVLAKLVPNIFHDNYSPALVEPLVDRMRNSIIGPEPTEPLDLLQLFWWDVQKSDVLPTLRVMQALSEDQLEVSDEGEVTVSQPKKIRGIGLVDFPFEAVKDAIKAGVSIVSLQIPYNLADRRSAKLLSLARENNIKVFARDGMLGGLISEKYVGANPPTTISSDPDLDSVAASLDQVAGLGGWPLVQELLRSVQAIANKHGVTMETVALRWQIDQGTFPLVTTKWPPKAWRQFGKLSHFGPTPGVDAPLFQKESFLDGRDMAILEQVQLLTV